MSGYSIFATSALSLLLLSCNTANTPTISSGTPSARTLSICDGHMSEIEMTAGYLVLESRKSSGISESEALDFVIQGCLNSDCIKCSTAMVDDVYN